MIDLTSKQVEEAIIFATEKHMGQTRSGDGRPYILHPMAVLHILSEVKKSKNMFLLFIASILHDVVEDCGVKIEEIAQKFGLHVAALVEELTTDGVECGILGKKEYLRRKMLGMSSYALVIKLCDRYHNVSDIASMSEDTRINKLEETYYILEGLTDRKLSKTHVKLINLIKKKLKDGRNSAKSKR